MYIVRKQDLNPDGGASYLVEATRINSKYRWGKTSRRMARAFTARRSASMWATRMGGEVVQLAG